MAHIEDRWLRKARGPDGKTMLDGDGRPVLEKDPDRHGKGSRYRVRYLDPDGRERNKSFAKKVQADRFKVEVEADVLRGAYVDPAAGKVTFRKVAEEVVDTRTLDPSTRIVMRRRLVRDVYPVIGSKEIGRLSQRPSLIQGLVRKLEAGHAPSYVKVVMAHVQLVFAVAMDDGLILKNPVKTSTVVLPQVVKKKLVPWTADQVLDMREALPERYRPMVEVGAGLGMRQGEIFGFGPDDVDWLRSVVRVDRQVKPLSNELVFAPPKGGKARELPLPESVKLALSEHMRVFEPVTVTLPWKSPDGKPTTARLFFSNTQSSVVNSITFIKVWHRALERAGIVPPIPEGEKRGMTYREHGMHMLRHYFASALLTDGESIQAVSEWLGHHSPSFTLSVYAHLMPASEHRMRRTIDEALRRPNLGVDVPETAHGLID